MRISFEGKINKNYCMVNTATFLLKEGGTITIDRNETDYTIENGIINMTWTRCYLWAINGNYVFAEPCYCDIAKLLKGATLLHLELEDDAPDYDYEISDIQWCVS